MSIAWYKGKLQKYTITIIAQHAILSQNTNWKKGISCNKFQKEVM